MQGGSEARRCRIGYSEKPNPGSLTSDRQPGRSDGPGRSSSRPRSRSGRRRGLGLRSRRTLGRGAGRDGLPGRRTRAWREAGGPLRPQARSARKRGRDLDGRMSEPGSGASRGARLGSGSARRAPACQLRRRAPAGPPRKALAPARRSGRASLALEEASPHPLGRQVPRRPNRPAANRRSSTRSRSSPCRPAMTTGRGLLHGARWLGRNAGRSAAIAPRGCTQCIPRSGRRRSADRDRRKVAVHSPCDRPCPFEAGSSRFRRARECPRPARRGRAPQRGCDPSGPGGRTGPVFLSAGAGMRGPRADSPAGRQAVTEGRHAP